jgi:hypothetical protein
MYKALVAVALMLLNCVIAAAQTWTFAEDGIEYVLQLPSSTWQVVSRVDVHHHREFINGRDEGDGYLRLRKIVVTSPTTAAEIFQRNEQFEFQSLPGYVVCSQGKGETIDGVFNGEAFSYEYVSKGRRMEGRVYYLQINARIFYRLQFTVAHEKLPNIREQMDAIAKSFRLK